MNTTVEKPAGIYPGMSRADYEQIDAINISRLIEGSKTMLHLKWLIDHPDTEGSEALTIGIATHLAVFEPAEFETRVVSAPDVDRRTKIGKEQWTEFQQRSQDKIILDRDQFAKVVAMRDALRAFQPVKEILDAKGVGEMTCVWRDEKTGILCKGIVDRFCDWHGWPMIPDLKTCGDASKREFARQIARYHYHAKAAWYLDGLNAVAQCERRFCWIAVEKEPPYAIALYEPCDETLSEGRQVYRRLLDRYAKCLETKLWPGYPQGVEPITLPKYAFGGHDE